MAVAFGDIAAAAELLYKLYEYYKDVKEADQDFRKLLQDVRGLAEVLTMFEKETGDLISESGMTEDEKRDLIEMVNRRTGSLKDGVEELRVQLKMFGNMGKVQGRLRFAHSKQGLLAMRSNLGNYYQHVIIVSDIVEKLYITTFHVSEGPKINTVCS